MDPIFIVLLCLVVLSVSAGIYVTHLLCRLAESRGRPRGWSLGLAGTLVTGVLSGLLFGAGISLQPGTTGKGLAGMSDAQVVEFGFVSACGLAVLGAVLTLWKWRRRGKSVAGPVRLG